MAIKEFKGQLDQQPAIAVREFTGKLDPAPVATPQVREFNGPLDTVAAPEATLTAYQPTIFERITDAIGLGGANRDRASNELAARRIAQREGITVDQVYREAGGNRPIFNPEGRSLGNVIPDTAAVLGNEALRVVPGAANAALRAIRGGNVPLDDTGLIDRGIAATERAPADFVDPNYESLTGIGDSIGYSVATTVPAVIAGVAGTAATSPVGGVAAGMGASGGVAYRASKDQFLTSLRDKMNEASMAANGRPMTVEEWTQAAADAEAEAVKYGAYEAIPEAISNALMLKAFKPLARGTTKPIGARLGEQAAALGAEQATETVTALGQNEAERAVGLTNEELDLVSAFRKQFLQTLITSGTMGGGIYAGGKVKDLARDFYQKNVEPRVAPNSALARAFNEEIAKFEADPNAARREAMRLFNPNRQEGVEAGTTIQNPGIQIPPVQKTSEPPEEPAPVDVPTPQPVQVETPEPVAAVAAEPEERPANRRTISTASGTKIDADFEVVPLSELRQAEGDLQNRDRTRATSDDQIREIVGNFDPTRLGESAETDRGAPIVGPDNIIESGNGRTRAIEQVYANDPAKAEAYKNYMRSLGFDPDKVDRPVLVRRRVTQFTPEQRRQFVIDSNTESTMRLTASERAKTDADILDEKTLSNYKGGDIANAGNAGFVRAFLERLPAASRSELIGPNNQISQDGIRRIENALMGRAYGSDALLSKLLEDRTNNIRSIGGAMLDVAGPISALSQSIKDGRVKKEFDITKNIVEAARIMSQLRDSNSGVQEYLDQIDAFNPIDPVTERILKSFVNSKLTKPAGRDKIADFLRDYVEQAQQQTTEDPLFEMEPVTPQAILDLALKRKNENENVPTSAGLFDASKPAPVKETNNDNVADAVEKTDEVDRSERVDAANADVDEAKTKKKSTKKAGPLNYQGRELGESLYDDAWTMAKEMGLLAEQAEPTLLTPERQINILSSVYKDVFGFKNVTIENNLNSQEAIDAMLDGYASIQSMMAVNAMPSSAISLNNTLSLRFLRSAGNALAYYSPSSREIGMVRRNDSFAHEWGHALDWHIAFEIGMTTDGDFPGRGMSGMLKAGAESKNPAIQVAFKNLNDAMFGKNVDAAGKIYELEKKIEVALKQIEKLEQGKSTPNKVAQIAAAKKRIEKFADQIAAIKKLPKAEYKANTTYYLEARMLDKAGATEAADGGYWQRPTEMLARSFEAFTAEKLLINDAAYEFATASDAAYQGRGLATEASGEFMFKAYPQANERIAIFSAWQDVMNTVRDQEILGPVGKRADTDAVAVKKADLLAVDRWNRWVPAQKEDKFQPFKRIAQARRKAMEDLKERQERDALKNKIYPGTQLDMVGGKVIGKTIDLTNTIAAGRFHTARGTMFSLAAKYPQSQILRDVNNMLFTDPGSGRYIEETFESQVNRSREVLVSRFAEIVEKHGIMTPVTGWSKKKKTALRDILVSQELPENADKDVLAAAKDMRTYMNDLYYWLKKRGLDIGFAGNYLNRMIDEMLVLTDPNGFMKKAAVAYADVFKRDFGTADAVAKDDNKTAAFLEEAGDLIPRTDPLRDKLDAARKLRADIERLTKQVETADNAAKIEAKIEEMRQDLAALVQEMHPDVSDLFSKVRAERWFNRIAKLVPEEQFGAAGPSASFSKGRELTALTDEVLKDYMITDPVELISTYISSMTKAAIFGQRFGHAENGRGAGWELNDKLGQLTREGISPEDLSTIKQHVAVVTGTYTTQLTANDLHLRSAVGALFTPVILSRMIYSQFAEPSVIGMRTGSFKDNLTPYLMQIMDAMKAMKLPMAKSWKESVLRRRQISQMFGTVSHHLFDEIMSNRDNMMFQSKWAEKMFATFYRWMGVHALTMSQRRAATDIGLRHASKQAQRFLDGDDAAGADLRDMNFDTKNEALIEALAAINDSTPATDLIASPYFETISAGVYRFVNEVIQNPERADKPVAASTPEHAYAYTLLAFPMAFGRNVSVAAGKRIVTKTQEGGMTAGAAYVAGFSVAFGMLAAMQVASHLMRAAAHGDLDDELDKMKDLDYMLALISSRTGIMGGLDPLINAFYGIKYQRDLTSMTAGANIGYILDKVAKIGGLAVRNSPNNNTAEYNAITAAYDLVLMPMLNYMILSRIPPAAVVMMVAGSSKAKNATAEAIVGPKDGKKGSKKDKDMNL